MPHSRFYLSIGERVVHGRRAGDGPPLVLLHQSPRSSAEMIPLLDALCGSARVIALDSPGFGLSSGLAPPDALPDIDAFADALEATLDALSLDAVTLYGMHTGAILAVRFAARFPQRVRHLVANGIMLPSAAERDDLLANYFPRFLPQWDGSHLAWLWMRLRDQTRFYPWYRRSPATRINWTLTASDLQEHVMDMLDAGDNYRALYRAVMAYDIEPDLRRLAVPTTLVMVSEDVTSRYVAALPALPPCVELVTPAQFTDVQAVIEKVLARSEPDQVQAMSRQLPTAIGRTNARFADPVDGVRIHLHERGSGGRVLLVLHDLGGSSASLRSLLAGFGSAQHVIAVDLPGHGESDALPDEPRIERCAAHLAAFLGQEHVEACDVLALGAAAPIAHALARCAPDFVGVIVLLEAHDEMPPATHAPAMDGLHLLSAWDALRERTIRRSEAHGAIANATELASELRDLLRAGDAARALAADARLAAPVAAVTSLVMARNPTGSALPLPADPRHWGPVIEAALEEMRHA